MKEPIHEIDRRWLEDQLRAAPYRFARSMPENPHFYTLRASWEAPEDFDRCALLIRNHGYSERYGRSSYTMYAFEGHKYWVMPGFKAGTFLINRKELAPGEVAG